MSVIYDVGVKAKRMDAVRDYFRGGTLELQTSGGTPIVIFAITDPGTTVVSAVWTINISPTTVAAVGSGLNVVTKAVIKRSVPNGSSAHITGLTVGTSGADVILDNTSITAGQNVTMSTATITHAA